jgi:hypothetical protein
MKQTFLTLVASLLFGMFSFAVGQVGSQAPAANTKITAVETTQSVTTKHNPAENCDGKQVQQNDNNPSAQKALAAEEKEWEKAVYNQ